MGHSKYEFFPSWVASLDAAIEADGKIKVHCLKCDKRAQVDLVALREKVGGHFTLKNRRTPCRLTPGCSGWNKFKFLHGVYRNLWDDKTELKWMMSPDPIVGYQEVREKVEAVARANWNDLCRMEPAAALRRAIGLGFIAGQEDAMIVLHTDE